MMRVGVEARGERVLRRQEMAMDDDRDVKTTQKLLAEIAALRERLAATSTSAKNGSDSSSLR
jgi:hypothetical protein